MGRAAIPVETAHGAAVATETPYLFEDAVGRAAVPDPTAPPPMASVREEWPPPRRSSPREPAAPRPARSHRVWTRGVLAAVAAALLALILAFHQSVPNDPGNLGSLLETFLPWLGWLIPPIAVWALLRRSATAAIVLIAPVIVWSGMYVGLLPDKSSGEGDIRVVTHNVDADNADIPGTIARLLTADADVIALQELTETAMGQYVDGLDDSYPYYVSHGTVALFSRQAILDSSPVDINIGWTRAMRATIETEQGPMAVYVAHLASVRVGSEGFTSQQRDATAEALGTAIAEEGLERVLLLGDLNGTMQDRSLAPITHQLGSTQAEAGTGFGFTWPASFPMARIDQILVRELTSVDSWSLEPTGSDHLPIAADLDL